jgi:predicted metalloendopeptidase
VCRRKFGGRGTLSNWWTDGDARRFTEKARCIENFYSSFSFFGHHVNGALTLGEDIADMGGVKVSYKALQALTQEQAADTSRHGGLSDKERRLFFLAWGQNWCVVERQRAAELQLFTDEHAPNKLRVNGPLMNFQPFATAYGCPTGSYMAPKEKCQLW